MNIIQSFLTTFLIVGLTLSFLGQSTSKNALFLGNSYTGVNNLPQTIVNIATSMGDTLLFDSNTPGGYTLQGHSTNATTISKIEEGTWDFVVLQEQSQFPSFPLAQVEAEVFPYATILDELINTENPCAETVFFMTWGRKNGDAGNCPNYPPICTYEGMDSLLNLRYRIMADDNDAILSPVGAVWNHIRQNFPEIELYQVDESHPSVEGTYAAACSFYTVLFRKDPTAISFNSTISTVDAENIKAATKLIVYDNLMEWHVGEYFPSANFTQSNLGENQVSFTNTSENASDYYWDFGDGNTSTMESPIHTYLTSGDFNVQLFANHCGEQDSVAQNINTETLSIQNLQSNDHTLDIYPNPAKEVINFDLDKSLMGSNYTIFDSNGKTVLTGKIVSQKSVIAINNLSDGIYLLKVGKHLNQTFHVVK